MPYGVKLTPGAVLVLAAVAAVAVATVAKKGKALADALNPLNHDNAAATAVNTLGGKVFTAADDPGKNADGSWSLGGWWFDVWNPGTAQAVADMSLPVDTTPAPAVNSADSIANSIAAGDTAY